MKTWNLTRILSLSVTTEKGIDRKHENMKSIQNIKFVCYNRKRDHPKTRKHEIYSEYWVSLLQQKKGSTENTKTWNLFRILSLSVTTEEGITRKHENMKSWNIFRILSFSVTTEEGITRKHENMKSWNIFRILSFSFTTKKGSPENMKTWNLTRILSLSVTTEKGIDRKHENMKSIQNIKFVCYNRKRDHPKTRKHEIYSEYWVSLLQQKKGSTENTKTWNLFRILSFSFTTKKGSPENMKTWNLTRILSLSVTTEKGITRKHENMKSIQNIEFLCYNRKRDHPKTRKHEIYLEY